MAGDIKGSLGVGEPKLRFGHHVRYDGDRASGSVSLSYATEWCNFLSQTVDPDVGTNVSSGKAFSMAYTYSAGCRFWFGGPTGGTAITRSPTSADAVGPDGNGLYDLYLADHYFSRIFKYTHVEGVEMEYRIVPLAAPVMDEDRTAAAWTDPTSMGAFTLYPWWNEPYTMETAGTGATYATLTEPNYMANVHPHICHAWPMPGGREIRGTVGFIPAQTQLYTDAASDGEQIAYNVTPATDTVEWINGDSTQHGYLGRYIWSLEGAEWPSFAASSTLYYQVQCRFIVKQRWWDLFPPVLFTFPVPQASDAEWKAFCVAVKAQDEKVLADAIAEQKRAVVAALPSPPDPLAAAAAAMSVSTEDDMEDEDGVLVKRQKTL